MINEELLTELQSAKGASLSCIAVSTPEIDALTKDILDCAYHPKLIGGNKPTRVFIWRPDRGYEEIALCEYVDPDDESQGLTRKLSPNVGGRFPKSSDFDLDDGVEAPNKRGNVYSPEGATLVQRVGYAIDFLHNFREETGSTEYQDSNEEEIRRRPLQHVIVLWRDWDNAIGMNTEHIDRQLNLLECISNPKSNLKQEQEIIPTIIMHTSGSWADTKDGKPMIPKELNENIRSFEYKKPKKPERIAIISQMVEIPEIPEIPIRPSILTLISENSLKNRGSKKKN